MPHPTTYASILLVTSCIALATSACAGADTAEEQPHTATQTQTSGLEARVEAFTPEEINDAETRFVTIDASSICPTPAQARLRDCGNSVEDRDLGYIVRRGERVTIITGYNKDGVLGAVRYTKPGMLPGFILAGDIASHPDTSHRQRALDAMSNADVVFSSTTHDALTRADLDALQPGALLHVSGIRPTESTTSWSYLSREDADGELYAWEMKLADDSVAKLHFATDPTARNFTWPGFLDLYETAHTYACDKTHCDTQDVIIARSGEHLIAQTVIDRYGVHASANLSFEEVEQ